ncbi:MAG: aldo/keto reductase [Bacillaceae bacterium]|nr:aldo/keto reductase [Bacillaceae bacterium]
MQYTMLGRTGEKVSRLGFGAMNLPGQDLEISRRALNYALDHGITYIDTAAAYRNSEEIIGETISHRRQEFFLATKTQKRHYKEAREEIERSLKRMKTDHVDLLQMHYVNYPSEFKELSDVEGALEAAIRAKEEGKVRYIGITGHRPELLAKWLGTGHFDTVLFHMSLVQRFAIDDLVPFCLENNIGMIGMKPLSGGFVQPVEKALRFSYSTDVHVVLSGMKTEEEVKANLAALEMKIDPEEKNELAGLAEVLSAHGCRRCNYCSCPLEIRIPDTMISSIVHRKYGLADKGTRFLEKHQDLYQQCAEYEPCREQPLCQQDCPYHLPIRETVIAAGNELAANKHN